MNKDSHDTYILENNCEVKVILATIPHSKVFIRNENGTLIVSEESELKEANHDGD